MQRLNLLLQTARRARTRAGMRAACKTPVGCTHWLVCVQRAGTPHLQLGLQPPEKALQALQLVGGHTPCVNTRAGMHAV